MGGTADNEVSSFYVGAPPRRLLRQEVHGDPGLDILDDDLTAAGAAEGRGDKDLGRPADNIKDRTRGAYRKNKLCN